MVSKHVAYHVRTPYEASPGRGGCSFVKGAIIDDLRYAVQFQHTGDRAVVRPV